jgi:DNA processing protein
MDGLSTSPPSSLALALLATEGAGRVAAGRLVERFGSYENLLATPREQVLTRLPGIPQAEALVSRLFDEAFQQRVAEAELEVRRLEERGIAVLTPRHPHWPGGTEDLERGRRPVVLYAFGDTAALRLPLVALLARPQLEVDAFERAQSLLRHLLGAGVAPVFGLQHGFDTVACKLAAGLGRPGVGVASSGLARIPGPLRPAAAALVRAGGVIISPFPMDHGPFPHDDVERAQLAAAISGATVLVGAPDGSPESRAFSWAGEHRRSLFSTLDEPPPGAEPVHSEEEMHRVAAAATRGD